MLPCVHSHLCSLLVLLLTPWLIVSAGAPDAADVVSRRAPLLATNSPDTAANEMILRFKPGASPQAIEDILSRDGLTIKTYIPAIDAYVVSAPAGRQNEALVDSMTRQAAVEYAEPNYLAEAALGPTDPDYQNKDKSWGLRRIDAEAAWDITTGISNVIVAVVDTGVYAAHPELVGRVLPGADFVQNDGDASDDNGHGTHIAGIIAAAMNNDEGSTGLAPGVSILPVKVLACQ